VGWHFVTDGSVKQAKKIAEHLGVRECTGGRCEGEGISQVAQGLKRALTLDSMIALSLTAPYTY
jgi:hypothetical protein